MIFTFVGMCPPPSKKKAGVKASQPYFTPPGVEQPGEWLRQLAKNRTPIACTLLARKSYTKMKNDHLNLKSNQTSFNNNNKLGNQTDCIAICQLAYRPTLLSFFRKDLASSLISFGRSGVASGMFIDNQTMPIVDASTELDDVKSDVKYMEKLEKLEYDAFRNHRGMWVNPGVRDSRPDLLEEAEFESNANIFQKLWRRLFRE